MRKDRKIVEYKNLPEALQGLRNKKIVLVGGCFDLFHFGHLYFLEKAKKLGDILMIALEPDEFIIKRKKRPNIHSQNQRAQILSNLEIVDYVIKLPFFHNDIEYFEMVKLIRPNTIAVTEGDSQLKNKIKQAKTVGAKVINVTKPIKNLSSSKIINDASFYCN